jgi:glycosyltransferase-like protein LARGE
MPRLLLSLTLLVLAIGTTYADHDRANLQQHAFVADQNPAGAYLPNLNESINMALSIIPPGYSGDFSDIFRYYDPSIKSKMRIIDRDDGDYAGSNKVQYITAPSYIVLGTPGEVVLSARWIREQITLFTQVSLDRIGLVHDLIRRWEGPLSIAIYIESINDMPALQLVINRLKSMIIGNHAKSVIISLLFGIEFLYHAGFKGHVSTARHPYDLLYPINALRNLALSQCQTELVFSLDTDFVPSDLSHTTLHLNQKRLLSTLMNTTEQTVAVVAAFEVEPSSKERIFSYTKLTSAYLTSRCMSMDVIPFHARIKETKSPDTAESVLQKWCFGLADNSGPIKTTGVQGATNFTRWFTATEPYHVLTESPKKLNRYFEPYIIGHRSIIPEFDPRFKGYSFNKRSHSIEMQYKGLKFVVVPEIYVIHRPHESSNSKNTLATSNIVKATVGRAYKKFLVEARMKYRDKK